MTTATASTRMTPATLYRTVSIAEAITWTLLIAGLVLKYGFPLGATGDLAVRVGGSIHGFVFLMYGATAILVAVNLRWRPRLAIFALVTAIVPFATIPFDRWLERTGKLGGGWRLEKTEDPRDDGWFDALVRWMLRHPLLLLTLVFFAVVVVFTILLTLGPPGGRG